MKFFNTILNWFGLGERDEPGVKVQPEDPYVAKLRDQADAHTGMTHERHVDGSITHKVDGKTVGFTTHAWVPPRPMPVEPTPAKPRLKAKARGKKAVATAMPASAPTRARGSDDSTSSSHSTDWTTPVSWGSDSGSVQSSFSSGGGGDFGGGGASGSWDSGSSSSSDSSSSSSSD